MFYIIGALENFTKFKRKTCAEVSFFKTVAGWMPATVLKKRL